MEAKEIMDIIVGSLASLGLLACFVGAVYCLYSIIVVDRDAKRAIKRIDDKLAEMEKEE